MKLVFKYFKYIFARELFFTIFVPFLPVSQIYENIF